MWCVGKLTEEYRQRMYDLLDLYARPFRPEEPVVCLDEKSKQLLKHARAPLPIKPGTPMRMDYEYVRAGTCNLFLSVRDHGRALSLARMGTVGNRGAVYAYAGTGKKLVSVVAGRSLGWKTGQWYLLAVDWRFRSIEFSLDGRTWHQASLVNTGFAHAGGPPGVLRIGRGRGAGAKVPAGRTAGIQPSTGDERDQDAVLTRMRQLA